jgi:hypothetical protein
MYASRKLNISGVLKGQLESMVCFAAANNVECDAYNNVLQGEQHGFRKADHIRSALEGELYFYGQVLGFNATYSPELQPMTIDNLKAAV